MKTLKEKIPQIEEIKLLKDNEDNTKQYSITSNEQVDLRKKLFEVLPKEEITIFELKKSEATLEEAFIKLIDLDKSNSQNDDEISENSKDTKKNKKEKKEKQKAEKEEQKEKKAKEKLEKKQAKENEKKEKHEVNKEKNSKKEQNKKEKGGKK